MKRLDFSDPQAGRGACDRKVATIKAHMKIHLYEGNDIDNAAQMVDAMQSLGHVVFMCSRADMCLNCSVSIKSTKIGTNMVFTELIKLRYGDTGASCT